LITYYSKIGKIKRITRREVTEETIRALRNKNENKKSING
jgi:hypothetical protein